MSKAKRRRKKRASRAEPKETSGAEMLTIAWSMMVLTTLICEIGAALTIWHARAHPEAGAIRALSFVLVMETLIVGTLLLVLTPVMLRLRRQRPPRGILVFAMIVGATPLAVLVIEMIAGG